MYNHKINIENIKKHNNVEEKIKLFHKYLLSELDSLISDKNNISNSIKDIDIELFNKFEIEINKLKNNKENLLNNFLTNIYSIEEEQNTYILDFNFTKLNLSFLIFWKYWLYNVIYEWLNIKMLNLTADKNWFHIFDNWTICEWSWNNIFKELLLNYKIDLFVKSLFLFLNFNDNHYHLAQLKDFKEWEKFLVSWTDFNVNVKKLKYIDQSIVSYIEKLYNKSK